MQEVPGNAARNVLRLSHHKRESAQHREIPLTDCRREFRALPRETLFNQTLRDRENHFFPIERLHLNIRRHIREGCDRKIQISLRQQLREFLVRDLYELNLVIRPLLLKFLNQVIARPRVKPTPTLMSPL